MIDTWLSSLTRALKLRQSIRSRRYVLGSRCHLKIKIPARSNLIGEWDVVHCSRGLGKGCVERWRNLETKRKLYEHLSTTNCTPNRVFLKLLGT